MVSAAVAGTTFRPLRSYTTLWDVTPINAHSRRAGPHSLAGRDLEALCGTTRDVKDDPKGV